MVQLTDIKGQRFGKLIVLEYMGRKYRDKAWWRCVCDCGKIVIVRGLSLRNGTSASCGCLRTKARPERCGENNPNWKGGAYCVDCGKALVAHRFMRCRACWQKFTWGENSSRWKDSLTDEERLLGRFIPGVDKWLRQIKERDDYTCQVCGQRGYKLVSHHLTPYARCPELRLELSNGVTMCDRCHREFHRKYGFDCSPEDFEDFKQLTLLADLEGYGLLKTS